MDNIELTVLVNKVNTGRVKEVGAAHGGTLKDRTSGHALAETEEPAVPLAEKVIDHDILCFTFDATKDATAFADAAAAAIGVAPGIFKGTMSATRNGKKFDLPLDDRDQAEIKQG
jgi:hypothetical protein